MRAFVFIALVIVSGAGAALVERAHPTFNAGLWCGMLAMLAFSIMFDATERRS